MTMNPTTPEPYGGIFGFLPIIIILLLTLPPVARILRRTGYSRWSCLLALIPLVNYIGLWILAYIRWPAVNKN
jgi:uncharacterized membrane protein YhaH (DUF805 family)